MSKIAQLAEEILAELNRVAPELLTRQQLAERCPSADGDPQKCSLALLELKHDGSANNVPKLGWFATGAHEGESYEDEPPRVRKQAQAVPAAAPRLEEDLRHQLEAESEAAEMRDEERLTADEERELMAMKMEATTSERLVSGVRKTSEALVAITHTTQAARRALESYIEALDDPILLHLLQCADHAERARERLTQGNAKEA